MGSLQSSMHVYGNDPYETKRLEALHRLELLDTPPTEAFDRITRMAARLFNLPISAVSLTDSNRQWFKSRVGIAHTFIPREKAPCAEVAESATMLVISDLLDNHKYCDSHLAQNGIRFYAGAPLITDDGYCLGAMCILGTEPREASAEDIASLQDLAAMVMSQIELQHALGRLDPISGLPNRKQFKEDFDDLRMYSACSGVRLLVIVNLARPEEVRDGVRVMGASHLEDLIRQSAASLRLILGSGRAIYHVAETQFTFFALPGVELEAYSKDVARLLRENRNTIDSPFLTTISVGIVPLHLGHAEYNDVLRMAHSASQDAFEAPEHVCIYSQEQDAAHLHRFTLLKKFGQAMKNPDRLRLVYQPRIDIGSGACIGAEALLRWTDPELGAVSPGEFMPLVELSSMARQITAWVLDTAIFQLKQWQQKGISIQVSVNISASNLLEPDFCERLVATLEKHQVDSSSLELELTESALMSHPGKARAMLESIAKTGVRLAIDDFGTGYSSLSYLQNLPAHVVKIDQSFVRELFHDERKKSLVKAMVGLSHDLGYRVVAEGIETEQAFAFLKSIGCNEAQGYLFAKPLPSNELTDWFGQRKALLNKKPIATGLNQVDVQRLTITAEGTI